MRKLFFFISIFIWPVILLGQFTETKNLSAARGRISTAVFGSKILFVGGTESRVVDYLNSNNCQISSAEYAIDGFISSKVLQNGRYAVFYNLSGVNSLLANLYVFDNFTNEWYTEQNPDGASQNIRNGFIVNNEVIFIDENDEEEFYTYNLSTRQWNTIPAQFSRREVVVLDTGNKVFFIGGKESSNMRSDSVHVFNKLNSTWDNFTLSEAKNGVTAIIYENKVVIAGGQSSNVNSDRSVDLVEIIDIDSYNIETLTLSERKNNLIGVAVDNKVIFSGGNSKNAEIINMDDFSLSTQDFNVDFDLQYLRGGVVNNKAVFGGGNNVDGNKIFVYDAGVEEWSEFTIEEPRSAMAFVSVGNRLFAAGGQILFNGQKYDEIFILENIPTSNNEVEQEKIQVTLFPNPAFDKLTIDMEISLVEKIVISMANGKTVNKILAPMNNTIDVSNLSSGTYYLTIYSGKTRFTGSFIKN